MIVFTPIPDLEELREELGEIKLNVRESMIYNVEKLRWKNEQRIERIKEYLQLPELEEILERKEILEKLEKQKRKIMEKSNKQFLRAYNHLKRNPDVKSEKYQETLEALKELLRKRD